MFPVTSLIPILENNPVYPVILSQIWLACIAAGAGLDDFDDSDDFVAFEATGADFHGFHRALVHHAQFFQVGVPPSSGGVFGVAHIITEHGAFITNFTSFRHRGSLAKLIVS